MSKILGDQTKHTPFRRGGGGKLYYERAYVQIEGNLKQGSKGVQIINTQGYQLPENGDFRIHVIYIPKYKKK